MSNAIRLENVSKKLGSRQILNNVSFTIETGDIFGYLGPNGAGKTTTIRILLGLMAPSSGKVAVLGKDVGVDENRRKVGFVLETDGLYDQMTGQDNLAFYSKLYGITQPAERIHDILNLVKLADRAKDKVAAYSKGMRQRLALARAMIHNPDILILDEPTAGVDPTGQVEVRQIILDMAARGKTIFFSSHNLDEVQRICNRIALINRGVIQLYGETEKLQRQMGKSEVQLETSAVIPEMILNELRSLTGINVLEVKDKTILLSTGNSTGIPDIVDFLVRKGVRIEQVRAPRGERRRNLYQHPQGGRTRMNRMLVLLRKDLKDILTSRTTYTYLIIPIFLSLTYLAPAEKLISTLKNEGTSAAVIMSAAQSTVNGFFYSLPLIIMMLICSVLASYAVVLDKSKRTIESLLATPLSLREIWIAKSLAVTIPAAVIGVVMSVIMVIVIEIISFVPNIGIIVPSPLALVTGIIIVPVLTFFVVSIVTCLQLIITNPRLASLVFSILFLAVFFSTAVTQIGLNLDFSLIYLIVIVILLGINYFLARFLTKERIVLSSKT